MPWVKSIPGLRDFLSLVIVHAPDEFPQEDFLKPEEQLNLERAFAELQHGLSLLVEQKGNARPATQLAAILDAAYRAYQENDDVRGAHFLQEFESVAFK